MTNKCWRFAGQYTRGSEIANYEYFACGELGSFLIQGGNAFPQIDGQFIQEESDGSVLAYYTGTQSVAISPNGSSTFGFYSSGNCAGCLSNKYDNLNGQCISQVTYGTPGKYNTLEECQAAPPESSVSITTISVPVFSSCDSLGKAVNIMQDVSVIKGTEDSELLKLTQLASLQGEINCNVDVAAIPDSWLIRPEWQRPQVIYQFAEIDDQGAIIGAPKYQLTLPHHKEQKPTQGLPNYQRGNWEIIYVLKDNSKITIHSFNEEEGMKILNAAKLRVIEDYLANSYLSKSCLVHTQTPIAQINVKNRMAKYYPTGTLTEIPEWIVKW